MATKGPHPEPPAPLALRTDHEQVIVRRSGVSWRAEWPQILWRALPSNSSQSRPIPRDPNHKPVLHTETHVFMERNGAKRSVSKGGDAHPAWRRRSAACRRWLRIRQAFFALPPFETLASLAPQGEVESGPRTNIQKL